MSAPVKLVDFTMGISVHTFNAKISTLPLDAHEALGRSCIKCGRDLDLANRGGFLVVNNRSGRRASHGGGICFEDLAKTLESVELWGYSEFRGILGPAVEGATLWPIPGAALAQAWRLEGRKGLEIAIIASRSPVSMKTPEPADPAK